MPESLTLLLILCAGGCIWPVATVKPEPIDHIIVCWLKNPGNQSARDELITVSQSFVGQIPGLKRVSAGRVLPSTRPAVDSSFDVAVVMTFEDEAALRAYYNHPAHLKAVETTLKPLVNRYVVYDFVTDRK